MSHFGKRSHRAGFTLIEMLVVIAIISILAAGLVVAVAGVMDKTQRKKTISTIEVLKTALNSYKNTFGVLPPVFGGSNGAGGEPSVVYAATERQISGSGQLSRSTVPSLSAIERNQAIRVYLEHTWEGYGDPFIPGSAQLPREDTDGDLIREYTDGWGLPLVFNRPGDDHFNDIDVNGNEIEGRFSTAPPTDRSGFNLDASKWPFEIYSFGSDNIDGYGGHPDHGDDIVSCALRQSVEGLRVPSSSRKIFVISIACARRTPASGPSRRNSTGLSTATPIVARFTSIRAPGILVSFACNSSTHSSVTEASVVLTIR